LRIEHWSDPVSDSIDGHPIAAAQGCDLAMMGAELDSRSQRNAERNGFRIANTRTKWKLRERSA
jgi:hypothetical protein